MAGKKLGQIATEKMKIRNFTLSPEYNIPD